MAAPGWTTTLGRSITLGEQQALPACPQTEPELRDVPSWYILPISSRGPSALHIGSYFLLILD